MHIPIQIPDDEYSLIDLRFSQPNDQSGYYFQQIRYISDTCPKGFEKKATNLYTTPVSVLAPKQDSFQIQRVDSEADLKVIDAYMRGSFPHKYNQNYILRSFYSRYNYHFLVKTDDKSEIIGYFMLLALPEYPCVWLESVAGISELPSQYQGANKLKILCNGLKKVVYQDPSFQHIQYVCFTTRREHLIQRYQEEGFTLDTSAAMFVSKTSVQN